MAIRNAKNREASEMPPNMLLIDLICLVLKSYYKIIIYEANRTRMTAVQ